MQNNCYSNWLVTNKQCSKMPNSAFQAQCSKAYIDGCAKKDLDPKKVQLRNISAKNIFG